MEFSDTVRLLALAYNSHDSTIPFHPSASRRNTIVTEALGSNTQSRRLSLVEILSLLL